jgi:hypothetical protein
LHGQGGHSFDGLDGLRFITHATFDVSNIHLFKKGFNRAEPVLRYQSQLLFRKSYKPRRVIRIRPTGKVNIVFRPVRRFGAKPQLTIVP